MSDEERYDEEQAERKRRAARKKARAINRRGVRPESNKRAEAVVATATEGEGKK